MVDLQYLLDNYKHCKWTDKPNKRYFPKTKMYLTDREKFNEIFQFAKSKYHFIKATPSGGIPYNNQVRHVQRFVVVCTKTSFELVLMTLKGCFDFVLTNGKLADDNVITGTDALKEIFNTAKEFGVESVFLDKIVNPEEGRDIKKEIESPIITMGRKEYAHTEHTNVHHIDFNSSYASRISEAYPELKPMYEYIYNHRKENNGYYKSVLNNSIGIMQSPYCLLPDNKGYIRSGYALSHFAKVAINGNNLKVNELALNLQLSGRKVLLFNTDGIWYEGPIYHDAREGKKLGQWKHDHINCDLYIKSAGAYQYREEGKITSVVRGYTSLDMQKPRELWDWKEIETYKFCKYEFDENEGVKQVWDE